MITAFDNECCPPSRPVEPAESPNLPFSKYQERRRYAARDGAVKRDFLIWQSMTAQVSGFCPVKSRVFGVMTAAAHSEAAAKNWSRAPAQGC
jgi:hypothetical protein